MRQPLSMSSFLLHSSAARHLLPLLATGRIAVREKQRANQRWQGLYITKFNLICGFQCEANHSQLASLCSLDLVSKNALVAFSMTILFCIWSLWHLKSRRHPPTHVDELRPTDSKFSIDEGLLRPEPKKNEIQLFATIPDDQTDIRLLEHSEEITGPGHPHLSGEHHRSEPHIGYGRMGLGGVSTFMIAGAGALQYNDFDPTMPLLEDDQKDLEAAQELIPGFSVLHGSINSNVYFQVLRKLRQELPHSDLHKVRHAKYYARLLPQLANKLTVLPSKNPSCMDNFVDPKQYAQCLDALAKDMLMGSQLVSPRDSEVYVLKDHAPYVDCLRLLATELRSS